MKGRTLMYMLGYLILLFLKLYSYVIIASVIVSWLVAFEVINAKNEQAQNLLRAIDKVTAPVYTPLRKFIPPIGGIDITPIVVIFIIFLLQNIVAQLFMMPGYHRFM
jgi:YggT family protein